MVNTYTTANLVEAEIRAENAFSSSTIPTLAQVQTWIQESSHEIEVLTNNVYTSTVVTEAVFDYDGSGIFRIPNRPLLSVEKVEYNSAGITETPVWNEVATNNYLTYLNEGEIDFTGYFPASGKKKLRLSYTYGQTSTPLNVQRLCTLMVADRVISTLNASQGNTEGGSIQVGMISVSDPSNYSINYTKQLKVDIQTLITRLGMDINTFVITRNYDG